MESQKTELLGADVEGIARAAALLRSGHTVAFPTETVYGLGADATNGEAVARIYDAKGRPSFNPLIAHVANLRAALDLVELGPVGVRLAEEFWPGPLTLVAPLRADTNVSSLVTAGLETLAVRVPAAPVALQLLETVGRPVAAPSANPSGKISPTQAGHVIAGLSGRISALLDGGACPVGLESTIVSLTAQPKILRAGGIPIERIEQFLGAPLGVVDGGDIIAPGMLESHYAPRSRLRLNAASPRQGERWLGFGPSPHKGATLSNTGDLVEAASQLFAVLHALDRSGDAPIAVAPIPRDGLGAAINDRLRRAAAPR
jgi:L-threonylcarbamoyladenylate synthase